MSEVHATAQTNRGAARTPEGSVTAAMAETLKLYHAWLGYLLTSGGRDVLRVKTEDIRRALETFSCSVEREGDEYVIRLARGGEAEDESAIG